MSPELLISPVYRQEQVILHARPEGYGGKGGKWAPAVSVLAREYKASTVLDYGCGRGQLAELLRCFPVPFDVHEYDPAVPGKDALPAPADLVVCTDVLEHIEPEKLPAVLTHLHELARKALFVVIATRPSGKTLTDGRNAHLILENDAWWEARVSEAGFAVQPSPPISTSKKVSREWVAVLRPGAAS